VIFQYAESENGAESDDRASASPVRYKKSHSAEGCRPFPCVFIVECSLNYLVVFSVSLSVRLSVMEVHWCIIANLGFKFRSHFTRIAAAVLLAGGSSRAMLASARVSCYFLF